VPSNLIASQFGFQPVGMLEFADRQTIQEAPAVSFT